MEDACAGSGGLWLGQGREIGGKGELAQGGFCGLASCRAPPKLASAQCSELPLLGEGGGGREHYHPSGWTGADRGACEPHNRGPSPTCPIWPHRPQTRWGQGPIHPCWPWAGRFPKINTPRRPSKCVCLIMGLCFLWMRWTPSPPEVIGMEILFVNEPAVLLPSESPQVYYCPEPLASRQVGIYSVTARKGQSCKCVPHPPSIPEGLEAGSPLPCSFGKLPSPLTGTQGRADGHTSHHHPEGAHDPTGQLHGQALPTAFLGILEPIRESPSSTRAVWAGRGGPWPACLLLTHHGPRQRQSDGGSHLNAGNSGI